MSPRIYITFSRFFRNQHVHRLHVPYTRPLNGGAVEITPWQNPCQYVRSPRGSPSPQRRAIFQLNSRFKNLIFHHHEKYACINIPAVMQSRGKKKSRAEFLLGGWSTHVPFANNGVIADAFLPFFSFWCARNRSQMALRRLRFWMRVRSMENS
jgi:hypothetical protein